MPSRRGLVAPQNTFLEKLIRRSNSQRKSFALVTSQPARAVSTAHVSLMF